MSTEFEIKPPMTFDEVLANLPPGVTRSDPIHPRYIPRHTFLRHEDGRGMWMFEDCGIARFERIGKCDASLLLLFGREVWDEYGLKYPEESGG